MATHRQPIIQNVEEGSFYHSQTLYWYLKILFTLKKSLIKKLEIVFFITVTVMIYKKGWYKHINISKLQRRPCGSDNESPAIAIF